MKRFFTEYETWMLAREPGTPQPIEGSTVMHFRERLKDEVENLAGSLRGNGEFRPYRFDELAPEDGKACNTLSVTI